MVFFAILTAALPALALLVIAIVSRLRSRQPVGTVIAEYAPLPNSNILFDAVLAGSDSKALAAALIDLALRKKIHLVMQPAGDAAGDAAGATKGAKPQFAAEIMPGVRFTGAEQRVLAVFLGAQERGKAARKISPAKGVAGRKAAALLTDTVSDLARRGLIAQRSVRWPSNVVNVLGWVGVAATLVIAGSCGAVWVTEPTAPAGVLVAVAAFGVTVAALIVCPRPWRRFLPPSQLARRHLAGMREYIRLAEADRLRVLQSPQGAMRVPAQAGAERLQLHEQLLPYAVLFGLEKQWAEVLRVDAQAVDGDALLSALDSATAIAELTRLTLQLAEIAGDLGELGALDAVGQVFDAAGSAFEGLGDLFSI
ncbi:DUF2207 family protein [Leucobacter sp. HY1908]